MYIDFSKIKRDAYGRIESPVPLLQTKHGKRIGPLSNYFNLKAELKYNEVSSVEFDLPAWSNGAATPHYDDVGSETLLRLDPYGIFILQGPQIKGDGIKEVKHCTAYSLEYELAGKQIIFSEGAYPFYDPAAPSKTLLGMAMECTRRWKIGHVSPTLYNRYRTFDQTDAKALDFLLDQAQKSYGCVFVFDTYALTVNVIDAEEDAAMLPVYLSFDNLLKAVTITESLDNMATRLAVSGADGVDIRSVNPAGTNELIDLGYHIGRGDIPDGIVQKYTTWKNTIYAKQAYYTSLTAMRNAASARLMTERARLTELEGELASLDNLRTVNVQGRAMATESGPADKPDTIAWFDARLTEIAEQYREKQQEISNQKELIERIQAEYDGHIADMQAVNDELRFTAFFSAEELDVLDTYLIDGVYSDPTYAVFDVDISGEHDSFTRKSAAEISFKDVSIADIETTGVWECGNHHSFTYTGTPSACPECGSGDLTDKSGGGRRILSITGGTIGIHGEDYSLSARHNSATLEYKDGRIVLSALLGSGSVNESAFPSGNISCVCSADVDIDAILSGMEKVVVTDRDEETGIAHDDISYLGNAAFPTTESAIYFTRNVTDCQRYSVEQDLYNHAESVLDELAYPVYEFSVDSGNLIWAQKFEPFKNALKLGCGVYLQLNDTTRLKPILLEVHLDFEKPDSFKLVFSSQYQTKRPDRVNKLKEISKAAQNAGRTLDTEKHKYGSYDTSGGASALAKMLRDGYDAALAAITAGKDQCVSINEAGIKIASVAGQEYIMLNNGMIALVDAARNEVKMAMGHFYNAASGTDFIGILADIIGGTLLAGKNLIIECPDVNGGVMQFKVDSSGVFLNNSRMYFQSDKGGKIGIDSHWGIFGGTKDLFQMTDTGHVSPSFAGANGTLVLDSDGFPVNANFLLPIDGDPYFRGTVIAKAGKFDGDIYARNLYFWDGSDVKTLLSEATKKIPSGLLDLGNIQLDGVSGDISLTGNINIGGNIDFSGAGSITWGSKTPVKYQFSATSITGPWHDAMQTNDKYRRDSLDGGTTWGAGYQFVGKDGEAGAPGTPGDPKGYLKSIKITEINQDNVKSALIEAATMAGANMYGGIFGDVPEKINGVYQIPNVWIEMGAAEQGYGLQVWHKKYSNTPIFSVYDSTLGRTTFSLKSRPILYQDSSYVCCPEGEWDFSGATVYGISAPATFG